MSPRFQILESYLTFVIFSSRATLHIQFIHHHVQFVFQKAFFSSEMYPFGILRTFLKVWHWFEIKEVIRKRAMWGIELWCNLIFRILKTHLPSGMNSGIPPAGATTMDNTIAMPMPWSWPFQLEDQFTLASLTVLQVLKLNMVHKSCPFRPTKNFFQYFFFFSIIMT